MPRDRYPSAPAVVVAFCADSIEADARHNIANLCPLITVFLTIIQRYNKEMEENAKWIKNVVSQRSQAKFDFIILKR